IPTALDLLRSGAWVAHSTIPNVHPPGVEAYLVVWYKLFGFSIPITRIAMLLVAAGGLVLTFLLAIELSGDAPGAPAFVPPILLVVSPLFYTQSMMAQLDMPAMVLTLLALLLFIKKYYVASAVACMVLVLTKETGLVAPAVFCILFVVRKDWKRALLFASPAVPLAAWLVFLHAKTGYWLGDPGFAHYNVGYALNPMRAVFSLARRAYYLFFAEFRWIGTLALIWVIRKHNVLRGWAWRVTLLVSGATAILVSVLGGAELERYLLPVLPVLYIAFSIAFAHLPERVSIVVIAGLLVALVGNLFWNPPYPFPYENNYAMVDFVRLQRTAAVWAQTSYPGRTIATAWPFTAALRSPDYGYVSRKLHVVETGDFHTASIEALPADKFDVLITYTRTWSPPGGAITMPLVERFLARFYEWQPDITTDDCERLGLRQEASWTLHGQTVKIYVRESTFR
ncbi:MAG TPA: hypothetical protein VH477_02280, partial [Bryobacteraceae bacterium]